MTIVSCSSFRPFDTLDKVGVAILQHATGLHCGFIYSVDGGEPVLVHLAWHHKLCRQPPEPKYLWADIAELEREERRVFAGFLSVIGGITPVDYALKSGGLLFDPVSGECAPHVPGQGFTCATFILAAFKSLGYTPILDDEWPTGRPGDTEAQAALVEGLRIDHPAHAALVACDIGCVRFRPEEVVGAAATGGWPHNLPITEALAVNVRLDLEFFRAA